MSTASTSAITPPCAVIAHRPRAARLLQFVGVLEIIFFGLATVAVLRAAGTSPAELVHITGANLSLEQLQTVHPHLKTFAMILALSGLVPGSLLLICSIGVRRGMSIAAVVAIVLAGTQLFALGGILIRQVMVAITQGEPAAMTMNVLALGTPMALLVFVIRTLFQLRSQQPISAGTGDENASRNPGSSPA